MSSTAAEGDGRQRFRLSCVVIENLPPGHVLSEHDVAFNRPGNGLPPKAIEWIVGRRLRHEIKPGKVLALDDFE